MINNSGVELALFYFIISGSLLVRSM